MIRGRALLVCWTALLLLGCGARGPRFDNVVLVTIDTLRADHLGAYGYTRPTSPFLDSLAASGVVFRSAYSSSSHTAPSHTSILTSLHPKQHRVLENGTSLPEGIDTLAALLERNDFETAAFTSVRFLEAITTDFSRLDARRRVAGSTISEALDFLEQRTSSKRLFLWVHLYDPHRHGHDGQPAPEAFREMFRRKGDSSDADSRDVRSAIRKRHIDRYDAQVAYVDSEIRRLYQAMASCCLEGSTLWVITADHGEGLGDHDYMGHGRHLYNEQVRVPLILHAPGHDWAVSEVDQLVRHVDLLPTIMEIAGAEDSRTLQSIEGVSLAPLLRSQKASVHTDMAFSQRRPVDDLRRQRGWQEGEMITIQDLEWKYIYNELREDELYDLRTDPRELTNLIRADLPRAERLRRLLLSRYTRMQAPDGSEDAEISPEFEDELRALGYIQ